MSQRRPVSRTKNGSLSRSLDFSGHAVIVTGAGTGIGEATAHKFASLGADVLCAGLPGDPVEDVADALRKYGVKSQAFEGDLAEPMIAQAAVEAAAKAFGKLDVLVSNAGVVLGTDTTDKQTDETFERTIRSNVAATFYVTRAALPYLKKSRGAIVAVGSVAGIKGEPGDTIYGGSKGFVHLFMQGLAVEQAKNGIRVNVVCPGVIDTAMTHAARTSMTKAEERKVAEEVPMKRRGTVEEIANAIAFLASDMASYMTGALVPVDGGYTLSWGDVEEVPSALKTKPRGELAGKLKHTFDGGYKRNNPRPKTLKEKRPH
jgi:NAD(P)-dependent dehydrogenase (short-subunit alcohol dehydrogenase family)